jgi:hypothetical protein
MVRVSGRGAEWRAEITDKGRSYLAGPPPRTTSKTPGATAEQPSTATAVPRACAGDEVPDDLRGAHQLVRATRAAAPGLKPEPDGRLKLGPRSGIIYMLVSRQQLPRGLLLAHGVVKGALRRGWKVERHSKRPYGGRAGVAIVIGEHAYPLEIHEETRTLPFTQQEIDAWRAESWWDHDRAGRTPPPQRKRKQPTGRLGLILPRPYGDGRQRWTDGTGSLNGTLTKVFAALTQRALEDDRLALEAKRRHEEMERKEESRAKQARALRINDARAARATAEIKAWREAEALAAYAAALRRRVSTLDPPERDRIERWCNWLEDRICRSDPIQSTALIIGVDDDRGW